MQALIVRIDTKKPGRDLPGLVVCERCVPTGKKLHRAKELWLELLAKQAAKCMR